MTTRKNAPKDARTIHTDAHMWFRQLMVFYCAALYVELVVGATCVIRLPIQPEPGFMQPPTILYDAEPNRYEDDIWENCWEEFSI